MKVELRKRYLDEYDLKVIAKAVYNLFDDYNYKKAIAQEYLDSIYQRKSNNEPATACSKYRKKIDSTYEIVKKREKVVKYLNEFDRKLDYLLSTLTADELKIYTYSVLAREQDKQVRDRICKTDKTYYPIKKSCYVKLALRFGLVDGFTKNVFATISLFD